MMTVLPSDDGGHEPPRPLLTLTEVRHVHHVAMRHGDGNGRTGCLLLNVLLVGLGYPPEVIQRRDRLKYLAALRKADAVATECRVAAPARTR